MSARVRAGPGRGAGPPVHKRFWAISWSETAGHTKSQKRPYLFSTVIDDSSSMTSCNNPPPSPRVIGVINSSYLHVHPPVIDDGLYGCSLRGVHKVCHLNRSFSFPPPLPMSSVIKCVISDMPFTPPCHRLSSVGSIFGG